MVCIALLLKTSETNKDAVKRKLTETWLEKWKNGAHIVVHQDKEEDENLLLRMRRRGGVPRGAGCYLIEEEGLDKFSMCKRENKGRE